MRKLDRARILRLCLCLVVVGIIISGAAEHTAAASATGSPPDIRAFSADPLILPDGGHAVYAFEVWNATKIQVVEAGETINEYSGPPSTTSKGKASGRTTYQIRTGPGDTFEAMLIASNAGGIQRKTLTLSFATKFKPAATSQIPPVSDNGTKARTSKWGTQAPAPANLGPSALSSLAPWPRQFAICPSGCQSCLQPSEAAAKGLTQKCLEQPCYYSPDKTQYWYCYGETKGWCCKDGKVTPATRDQCATAGGSWYATEAEATRACQSSGWCCRNGQVSPSTQAQCVQSLAAAGGVWYATQAEAMNGCGQVCWCCTNGRYGQTTADACANMGGTCYATQAQASERCQPVGWYCVGGKVYPGTSSQAAQSGAAWYATQAEATRACAPPTTCWCCTNGRYGQTTADACANMGGTCYATQAQASERCQPPPTPTYWCCSNGQVYQSRTPGTGCYATQAEAQRACIIVRPPINIPKLNPTIPNIK